jgi:heme oxygenase
MDAARGSHSGRLRRLRDDIRSFGDFEHSGTDPYPSGGAAWSMGYAYVVFGSALGGQVLYSCLDYLLGATSAGRSFFCLTGEDRRQWRELCHALDGRLRLDESVQGANRAFQNFADCVDGAC